MAIAALMGIVIPVALFLVFRKKYKADVAPFFIGCAVFIVFALLLEGTTNFLIFQSGMGKAIQSNIWLYAIFGGLMAGFFEETGRYTAFKTVLKKKRGNDRNALMYGAGHGGFEAFYILFVSMVSYIVMATMLNAGMYDKLTASAANEAALQALNATFAALSSTAPAAFLMSIVERVAAAAFQISCSVLVWVAAKDGKRFLLYPLAILLHALLDAVAVILARHITNLWIVEGAIYVFTACCVLLAILVWKKCVSEKGVSAEIGADGEA
jgi:uncharacterized membrane protein YhfC